MGRGIVLLGRVLKDFGLIDERSSGGFFFKTAGKFNQHTYCLARFLENPAEFNNGFTKSDLPFDSSLLAVHGDFARIAVFAYWYKLPEPCHQPISFRCFRVHSPHVYWHR